jgi:predicted TPR repeat methyltransferase
MVGVDLSAAMLAQARAKGLYDRLIECEILAFLEAEAKIGARYHLILAADVFMYFNDLAPVLKAAAQLLVPDGTLAFSVETQEGNAVLLRETLRYAQDEAHVRAALASAGLKAASLDSAATRTEKGAPVPGLIVVATH